MKKAIIRKLVPLFIGILVFGSSCSQGDRKPMGVRSNVDIPEGESLHYSVLDGGDKVMDFYMVTEYVNESTAKAYLHFQNSDSTSEVPDTYNQFKSYAIVNLSKASMIEYFMDESDYVVKQQKRKGPFSNSIIVDGDVLTSTVKTWDGHQEKVEKSTVKDIDVNYPIWTVEAFSLWGGRLLNWEDGGAVLIAAPVVQKKPFSSYLVEMHDETITTPVGTFETTKVQWRVSSFFLDMLMKAFTDSMFVWIEKGPKHRVIKMSDPMGREWVLVKSEEVKIIK